MGHLLREHSARRAPQEPPGPPGPPTTNGRKGRPRQVPRQRYSSSTHRHGAHRLRRARDGHTCSAHLSVGRGWEGGGAHHSSGGRAKVNAVWIRNALTTTTRRRWRNRNGGVKTAAWRTFRRRLALHHGGGGRAGSLYATPPAPPPPPPPRVLKDSWGVGCIRTGCSRPPRALHHAVKNERWFLLLQ